MGTSLEDVLEGLFQLDEHFDYWRECQPHKYSSEAHQKIKDAMLILKS